ncbi:MAG: GNAT family N-acetyltransferase [Chitinophagales bacterium]
MQFTHPSIKIATQTHIPALETLLNSAYRGEISRLGWTTEAHLISGDVRTNKQVIEETMLTPGSVFLVYIAEDETISGCVNLQKHESRLYLGMFSVSPKLQGLGIGKQILTAAEEYAIFIGCDSIYMSVISVREELIQWYIRHGYRDTGERKAFEEDGIHGKHLQVLEFMILEKYL